MLLGNALAGDDDAAEVLHKASLSQREGVSAKSCWIFAILPDRTYTAAAKAARVAARDHAKSNKKAIEAQFGYTLLGKAELKAMEGEAVSEAMAVQVAKLEALKESQHEAHYTHLGTKPAKAKKPAVEDDSAGAFEEVPPPKKAKKLPAPAGHDAAPVAAPALREVAAAGSKAWVSAFKGLLKHAPTLVPPIDRHGLLRLAAHVASTSEAVRAHARIRCPASRND